jgi:hypothetical protein
MPQLYDKQRQTKHILIILKTIFFLINIIAISRVKRLNEHCVQKTSIRLFVNNKETKKALIIFTIPRSC